MSDEENQDDSPWLYEKVDGVYYFIHEPTGQCGIHIRGFSKLCGGTHSTIVGILQNAQKANGEVVQNYETELYNLLKYQEIYLQEVVQN